MIQKDEIRQVLESAKALGIEFAELFFEDLGKVVHIQNTDCSGHGGNAAVSRSQQYSSTVNTLGVDVIHNGGAGVLLKETGQVRRADKAHAQRCFRSAVCRTPPNQTGDPMPCADHSQSPPARQRGQQPAGI